MEHMDTILQGDVMEQIKLIDDESVDCIVTSPPYFQQVNYQVKGQWGMEETIPEYMDRLMMLMKECDRVLKSTGTVWVNIGDTYGGSGGNVPQTISGGKQRGEPKKPLPKSKMQSKALLCIPERFLIRMDDSKRFVCRSKIVWNKLNAKPESVKDRPSNRYEMIYMFSKPDMDYYFNLNKIRVPAKNRQRPFNIRVRDALKPVAQSKLGYHASEKELATHNKRGEKLVSGKIEDSTRKVAQRPDFQIDGMHRKHYEQGIRTVAHKDGKNPGNIWEFVNENLVGVKHYAHFPVRLIETILSCACPTHVCTKCGYAGKETVNNTIPNTDVNARKKLQSMWEEIQNLSFSTKAILLSAVYKCFIREGVGFEKVQELWGGVSSTGRSSKCKILLNFLCKQGYITKEEEDSISSKEFKGVLDALEQAEQIIRVRTQDIDGKKSGKKVVEVGGSASYKRDEGRQSLGKFNDNAENNTRQITKAEEEEIDKVLSLYEDKSSTSSWACSKCGNNKYDSGVVLDVFLGSGTVAIAAKKMGLHYVGIELSKKYVDIAKDRIYKTDLELKNYI